MEFTKQYFSRRRGGLCRATGVMQLARIGATPSRYASKRQYTPFFLHSSPFAEICNLPSKDMNKSGLGSVYTPQ